MKIVSVSPYLPFRGIDHAGGEYYRRHAEILGSAHDLVLVAPVTPANETAMNDAPGPYRRLLVHRVAANAVARTAGALVSRAVPFLPVDGRAGGLLADQEAAAVLQAADRIELQWFSSVVLARRLRRRFPDTPLVGVFHDVVSQGQRRAASTSGSPMLSRPVGLVRWLFAAALERRAMRCLDVAIVLSDKDAALLARRGGSARLVVVAPPLDEDRMPVDLPERPGVPEVLFVGALGRSPNRDAVHWLLDEIWPRVRRAVPDARLVIAGGGAGPDVERAAQRQAGVELTGYVPDLAPFYRRAAVAVAPLRAGAGVKLKCVTAMLWGVPVIATSVGAEGIDGPDVFAAVTDDADAFAAAVVGLLHDPASVAPVVARAWHWARDTYSSEAYQRSLLRVYG